MSPLTGLETFFAEPDGCGERDKRSPVDGSRVVVTRPGGAVLNRQVQLLHAPAVLQSRRPQAQRVWVLRERDSTELLESML